LAPVAELLVSLGDNRAIVAGCGKRRDGQLVVEWQLP